MTSLLHIAVCRKPIEGTIAENCIRHGCGGLAIDRCRIGTTTRTNVSRPRAERNGFIKGFVDGTTTQQHDFGRWPANIVVEKSDEVLQLFPQNCPGCKSPSSAMPESKYRPQQGHYNKQGPIYGDEGNAARFFFNFKER